MSFTAPDIQAKLKKTLDFRGEGPVFFPNGPKGSDDGNAGVTADAQGGFIVHGNGFEMVYTKRYILNN